MKVYWNVNYSNFYGEEVTHSLPIATANKPYFSWKVFRVTLEKGPAF